MILTLKITDRRRTPGNGLAPGGWETIEIVDVQAAQVRASVIAAFLRAAANDLDPALAASSIPTFASGGTQ